jgi:hypothetical protein
MLFVKTLFLSDAKRQKTEVFTGDPDGDVFLSRDPRRAETERYQEKDKGKHAGNACHWQIGRLTNTYRPDFAATDSRMAVDPAGQTIIHARSMMSTRDAGSLLPRATI